MGSDIGIEILIVVILIILNGLFSMTELAIINARKGLLEEKAEAGNLGARMAIKLAEDPNEMFSTIQIGITLISIVTGLYSGATFSDPMATSIKEHILWRYSEPYFHRIFNNLFILGHRGISAKTVGL